MESHSIHARLRAATETVHTQIEKHSPMTDSNVSIADYQHYLSKLYGFYIPIEAQYYRSQFLSNQPCLCELKIEKREKVSLLRRDLIHLQINPASVAVCNETPQLNSSAQTLGCLYVLEGSTLGSRIILKHLKQIFPKTFTSQVNGGFFYLDAYGEATGIMWNQLVRVLNEYSNVNPHEDSQIIDSALSTFQSLKSWFAR